MDAKREERDENKTGQHSRTSFKVLRVAEQ
jgi:hypothetical protein